eukprot:1155301-Prorocentrum_minimum.AAC.3
MHCGDIEVDLLYLVCAHRAIPVTCGLRTSAGSTFEEALAVSRACVRCELCELNRGFMGYAESSAQSYMRSSAGQME